MPILLDSSSLSLEEMRRSEIPVIRGLAMLDARLGKRRLSAYDLSNEHLFVRYCHALRRQSENVQARMAPDDGAWEPGAVLAAAREAREKDNAMRKEERRARAINTDRTLSARDQADRVTALLDRLQSGETNCKDLATE
jgi:hypothetical protein